MTSDWLLTIKQFKFSIRLFEFYWFVPFQTKEIAFVFRYLRIQQTVKIFLHFCIIGVRIWEKIRMTTMDIFLQI